MCSCMVARPPVHVIVIERGVEHSVPKQYKSMMSNVLGSVLQVFVRQG